MTKLEQTHKETLSKLQDAKKMSHVPSSHPAPVNSNVNIGVMDRRSTSSVPTLQMKGNN